MADISNIRKIKLNSILVEKYLKMKGTNFKEFLFKALNIDEPSKEKIYNKIIEFKIDQINNLYYYDSEFILKTDSDFNKCFLNQSLIKENIIYFKISKKSFDQINSLPKGIMNDKNCIDFLHPVGDTRGTPLIDVTSPNEYFWQYNNKFIYGIYNDKDNQKVYTIEKPTDDLKKKKKRKIIKKKTVKNINTEKEKKTFKISKITS